MITISDGILTIPEGQRFIGFSGDNLCTQKKFFIRNNTQRGWIYRLYLTFDDGRHNFFTLPATVSSEGTWLTWNIEENHIFKSGLVRAQIKAFSDENQVYHTTTDVFVAGKCTEEDEEFKNTNSEFLYFEKELNELYGKMQNASAKMPYVGTNGNWYTYDINAEAYLDSGVSSSISIEDMIIPPEKLDRKYWQKFDRIPVVGYDNLDAILKEPDCADAIFRLEFSGLSPVKNIVGEGSFVTVSDNSCNKLLIVNIENGRGWTYEKESQNLEPVAISADNIEDGSITEDKLRYLYWSYYEVVPVVGFDYLEMLLKENRNKTTVYRVEFSGLSPVKSVVGEGSFIAVINYNSDKLMLVNTDTGEQWIYQKDSYSLYKAAGNSKVVNVGVVNTFSDFESIKFKTSEVYLFKASGYFEKYMGTEWCFACYSTEQDPENPNILKEVLKLVCLATGVSWKINLTDETCEQTCKLSEVLSENYNLNMVSGTEYRLKNISMKSLVISFADSYEKYFESSVVLRSGPTPTSLVCPSFVKWSGDDVASVTNEEDGVSVTYNCLVPQPDKVYNIIFWYDGFNMNAVARGVSNA